MPLSAIELRYQLVQTAAFINSRPVDLVLQPKTPMVSDGSGGKKKATPTPRPAQRFRFVEQSDGTNRLEQGSQYAQIATLLGMPGVVIAVDDEFTYDGANWKVDEIQFPNEWEIRATVMRYGR